MEDDKREVINISDWSYDRKYETFHGGKDKEFKFIEDEVIDTDLEKSMQDIRVVLQRKSDESYFEVRYWYSAYSNVGMESANRMTEVFKKVRIQPCYYYE